MSQASAFIKEKFLQFFLPLRNHPLIWSRYVNRVSKRLFQDSSVHLSDIQRALVAALRRDGIATIHIDHLFPNKHLLQSFQQWVNQHRSLAQVAQKKTFLIELVDSQITLDLGDPLVQFYLHPVLLDVINSYFQMWSTFYYYSLSVAQVMEPDSLRVYSQQWHRDPEEVMTCKVFVYIQDVDETSGPFSYVRGSHLGGKWRSIFPQRPPKGSYPPPQVIEGIVPSLDIQTVTGTAGTVIFCDTSGLHCGGYASQQERIMLTGAFLPTSSVWRKRYYLPPNIETLIQQQIGSPQSRFALTSGRLHS
ncbi:hypothetical protein EXS71_04580 [Candidatus Uhrbacteria bacterium]|nr:hypothetical protein [Candidatus Uhrbacteria bacterium]